MRSITMKLAFAATAASLMLAVPGVGVAAEKKVAAKQEASWDGVWTGKWGGQSAGRVTIKKNKVTSYFFKNFPQTVGSTTISGNTLSFGSGYNITMTMSGSGSANASYKGNGTAKAVMTRK